MGKSDEKSLTVPQDPRYQHTDVTKWCYTSFIDYHRCTRLLGKSNPGCSELQKVYKAICPNGWISKWEEQINTGTFPVDLPEPCKPKKK